MAEKTIPAPAQEETQAPATRDDTRYQLPPVDIYETEDALTLVADMPGVSQDTVEIDLDNDVLTIKGTPAPLEAPGENVAREFDLLPWYRAFTLNADIDQERIKADLKNGVLTLTLPNHAKRRDKPRKIPVSVG
jgi:HSP20 family protein